MTSFDVSHLELSPVRVSDRDRVASRVRAPAWPRRTLVVTLLCLIAFAIAAASIWPATGTVVPWDSKNQFYPMFRFLGDSLRHGTVPLWNPYQYAGYPSAADPQSLLFTPTMLLFALVSPHATMQVFDAIVFAHLAMGGLGVIGLARRWRWHPSAGLLTALVFMVGGAASSRLEHTGMIISYSYYPLALWSLQAALDRRSLRLAVVAGCFATLMAVGRDQVAYLLCLSLAGGVIRQALRSEDWLTYLRGRAPVILVAGAVTLVAMIVPILVTLQFVRDSSRPGIAYGMALAGSLDPINLLTLLAPNGFGSLDQAKDYWGPGAATLAGNDWTDPTVDYLFVGTLPLVLVVWHGLAGGRLLERGARYFALLMIGALVYAMGRHTSLFGIAFDWLPGVSLYRRPADASFLVNIALAFLAGYLLHRFVEEGLPEIHILRSFTGLLPITTILLCAWLLGAGLSFARSAGHLDQTFLACGGAFGFVAGIVAALILLRSPSRRSAAAVLLVAATAGQLMWRNVGSVLNAQAASAYAANATLPPDQARGIDILRQDMASHIVGGVAPRVEIQGIDGPWQNAAMIFKLQNVAGYNPLRISTYERAVGVGESTNDPMLRSFPNTFRGYNSRLAAMLGLRYLILDSPITALPRHYPRPRASLIFSGDGMFIYRLDTPVLPRAHIVSHVVPARTDDVIDEDGIPDIDLATTAFVDPSEIASIRHRALLDDVADAAGKAPEPASHANIISYETNSIRVAIESARPGLLVLHEIAYPGWDVTIDGQGARIIKTDLLFRGVEVPAGHHIVEFAFRPFAIHNLLEAARSLHKEQR